ncbi:hypothetical protein FF1_030868 [Malus domestica]
MCGRQRRVLVALEREGDDDGKLFTKPLKVELRLVIELRSIEEDEDPVESLGFDSGEEFGEGMVVEANHPSTRSELERE